MEIIEHLVIDDQVIVDYDLYVAEHLFVGNKIADGESLAYVVTN